MNAIVSTTPRRREIDAAVGLLIFLGATAMVFAALLLAYAILRAQAPSWPPAGTPPFPRVAATANTAVLLAASLALRHARPLGRHAPVLGALALGTLFLALQGLLWRHLVAHHLGPSAGPLGDVFFALSAFHALHVVGGLIALAFTRARSLRLLTIYWDFVLVVWLIICVAVCWL